MVVLFYITQMAKGNGALLFKTTISLGIQNNVGEDFEQ